MKQDGTRRAVLKWSEERLELDGSGGRAGVDHDHGPYPATMVQVLSDTRDKLAVWYPGRGLEGLLGLVVTGQKSKGALRSRVLFFKGS